MANEVNERIEETIEMLRTIRAGIISDTHEMPCRIDDVTADSLQFALTEAIVLLEFMGLLRR